MKKIIYYGSVQQLPQPTFNGGKAHNDYGKGFYCTEEKEMAAEWAVGKGSDGWINCYEMDCENLKVLDLNGPEFCILHWLAVLLENRTFDISYGLAREAREYILQNFAVDYSHADIIVGYRADDSYFSFAQDFLFICAGFSFRRHFLPSIEPGHAFRQTGQTICAEESGSL